MAGEKNTKKPSKSGKSATSKRKDKKSKSRAEATTATVADLDKSFDAEKSPPQDAFKTPPENAEDAGTKGDEGENTKTKADDTKSGADNETLAKDDNESEDEKEFGDVEDGIKGGPKPVNGENIDDDDSEGGKSDETGEYSGSDDNADGEWKIPKKSFAQAMLGGQKLRNMAVETLLSDAYDGDATQLIEATKNMTREATSRVFGSTFYQMFASTKDGDDNAILTICQDTSAGPAMVVNASRNWKKKYTAKDASDRPHLNSGQGYHSHASWLKTAAENSVTKEFRDSVQRDIDSNEKYDVNAKMYDGFLFIFHMVKIVFSSKVQQQHSLVTKMMKLSKNKGDKYDLSKTDGVSTFIGKVINVQSDLTKVGHKGNDHIPRVIKTLTKVPNQQLFQNKLGEINQSFNKGELEEPMSILRMIDRTWTDQQVVADSDDSDDEDIRKEIALIAKSTKNVIEQLEAENKALQAPLNQKKQQQQKQQPGGGRSKPKYEAPTWLFDKPVNLSEEKKHGGKNWSWCPKCNSGNGKWVCTHTASGHTDNYKSGKSNGGKKRAYNNNNNNNNNNESKKTKLMAQLAKWTE